MTCISTLDKGDYGMSPTKRAVSGDVATWQRFTTKRAGSRWRVVLANRKRSTQVRRVGHISYLTGGFASFGPLSLLDFM